MPIGGKINTILPFRLVIYLGLACVRIQNVLEEQNNTFPFIFLWQHLAEGYCFANKTMILSAISYGNSVYELKLMCEDIWKLLTLLTHAILF